MLALEKLTSIISYESYFFPKKIPIYLKRFLKISEILTHCMHIRTYVQRGSQFVNCLHS